MAKQDPYFKRVKLFSEATRTQVDTMYDIPKLLTAMEAFGWFDAAHQIREETLRLNDAALTEFEGSTHGSTST